MKKTIFLIILLWVVICNPLWSAELDTVWVSDYISQIRFQHPVSKNLILSNGLKIRELDSKDGKLVKEIEFGNESKLDLTPDGTKLLSVVLDDTYIYEYPSMELIIKLKNSRLSKFTNNSEIILETSTEKDYSTLVKYNFITKEKTFFDPVGNIQDIATSADGRFIAISTNAIVGSNESWTKLYLLDAKTMTEIALLEDVKLESNTHYFARMNFSYDGKYLATNATAYISDLQRNIYSTETLKSIKNYNPFNFKTEILFIDFLNDNLYTLEIENSNTKENITQLKDINTDKVLLEIGNSNGIYFLFYNELNYLYYFDTKNRKTICLNLTNLITGISTPQPTIIVIYQNKVLTINKENVRKIEISDLNGRMIMNKIIENPFTNNTTLPINLINGSYLINITTDKESFTHKLLVLE